MYRIIIYNKKYTCVSFISHIDRDALANKKTSSKKVTLVMGKAIIK